MVGRRLTVYYVYDTPAELYLAGFNPVLYMVSDTKYSINSAPRAPTSKGIHRVWEVNIIYDTPTQEEIPVTATWNNGDSLRTMGLAIFSSGSFVGFNIWIQEPNIRGYKEGFS